MTSGLGFAVAAGLADAAGFAVVAGLAAGFAAPVAAGLAVAEASGLAEACCTFGLAAGLLSTAFGSAAPSGCFAATFERLPRLPVVCFSESVATAAIRAAPDFLGPV
ncbi:MAG: hypothetical protein DI543_13785 [Bradyrhizobium icense]|nr:MAG: hypothetical protein DI543_13785 [Bradyrhizobium icense]